MKRKQLLKVKDRYDKLQYMLCEFIADIDFYGIDLDNDESALKSVNAQMAQINREIKKIAKLKG